MIAPLPRPKDPPLARRRFSIILLILFAYVSIMQLTVIMTIQDNKRQSSGWAGFFMCGVIPMGLAGYAFWNLTKKKKKHEDELRQWLESNILRYAASQKGRVTAEEIAMQFNIEIPRAKEILENIVVRGTAELHVSDSGTLVYSIKVTQ